MAENGAVAFAMQWQGDLYEDLPLLGIHDSQTGNLRLMNEASVRRMNGYLGSVAITPDRAQVATTSPRSGRFQVFEHGQLLRERAVADVCGVAATRNGFVSTAGTGHVISERGTQRHHPISWDNHILGLGSPVLGAFAAVWRTNKKDPNCFNAALLNASTG